MSYWSRLGMMSGLGQGLSRFSQSMTKEGRFYEEMRHKNEAIRAQAARALSDRTQKEEHHDERLAFQREQMESGQRMKMLQMKDPDQALLGLEAIRASGQPSGLLPPGSGRGGPVRVSYDEEGNRIEQPAGYTPPPFEQGLLDRSHEAKKEKARQENWEARKELAKNFRPDAPFTAAEVAQTDHRFKPITPKHFRELKKMARDEREARNILKERVKKAGIRGGGSVRAKLLMQKDYSKLLGDALQRKHRPGVVAYMIGLRGLDGVSEADATREAFDIFAKMLADKSFTASRALWTVMKPMLESNYRRSSTALEAHNRVVLGQGGRPYPEQRKEKQQLLDEKARDWKKWEKGLKAAGMDKYSREIRRDAEALPSAEFKKAVVAHAQHNNITITQAEEELESWGYVELEK